MNVGDIVEAENWVVNELPSRVTVEIIDTMVMVTDSAYRVMGVEQKTGRIVFMVPSVSPPQLSWFSEEG